MKITHIVPRISYGAGMPSIINEAIYQSRQALDIRHEVISLEPNLALPIVRQAMIQKIRMHIKPQHDALIELLENAELVVLQYWNCPSVYEFIQLLNGLKVRLLINCHVNGRSIPQIIPDQLTEIADGAILNSPHLLDELKQRNKQVHLVPAIVNIEELPTQSKTASFDDPQFKIINVGTLNFFKIHPQLIPLHTNLNIADYQFNIFGSGGSEEELEKQITEHDPTRLFLRGFSDNLWHEFAKHHLLSHPLNPMTYAASERVVQESMHAGLPVIMFNDSPSKYLVENDHSGFLVNSYEEYRHKLELLGNDRVLLQQMSSAALDRASREFSPLNNSAALYDIYASNLKSEKNMKSISLGAPDVFLRSLVEQSGSASNISWPVAENSPGYLSDLNSLTTFMYACEGGLAHYINYFPDDTELRKMVSLYSSSP